MVKKIYINLGLSFLFLIITMGNIQTIKSSLKGLERLQKAENELDAVKTETANLVDKIEETKTDEFLEEEALERFKLVKEPSTILIVEGTKTVEEQQKEESKEQKTSIIESNLQKWARFFNL